MDDATIEKIALVAGGALAGILGYSLLPKREELYTGLTREYRGPYDEGIAAVIWANPKGYIIRFEGEKADVAGNPFPDFESPTFTAPFAAALYADDIADNMDLVPVGPWAKNTNEAAAVRDLERKRS